MSIRVGDRIAIKDKMIRWCDGRTSPAWCVAPGVTFEVLEVKRVEPGVLRVVIGNHNGTPGKITYGVTGAILVRG